MIMQLLRNLLCWSMLMLVVACSTATIENNQSDTIQQAIAIVWPKNALSAFNQGMSQIKNKPDEAILAFQKAINLAPKMEAAYYNLMHIYYDKKDHQQLTSLFDIAQKEALLSARVLTIFASDQRRQGHFSEAEKHYALALEKDSNYLSALANMAILQDIYLHRLAEALKYYLRYQEQLIAQGKDDRRVVDWLADIKQRISKLNKETGQ